MKRILFISSCYPSENSPQYCIFIEQQAQALKSLGYHVDVLVPKQVVGLSNDIKQYLFHDIDIWEVKYKLSKLSKFIYFKDKYLEKQFKKLLTINKYEVVSIHIASDSIKKVIVDVCKKNNVKVVIHYHGLNVWENYNTLHKYYEKYLATKRIRILRKADAIIGVSNSVSDIIAKGISNKKIYTVYNGVDTTFFKPDHGKKENPNEINITCVANLIKTKGHEYLINAFAVLFRSIIDKKLVLNLVGSGVELSNLTRLVSELGIKDHVKFWGSLKYDKVNEILSKSDIFVMPSYYEALGCVYLEAMACKVPVVGCKGQGIEELIVDGKTGMLVNPQDTKNLVEKLTELIENSNLRNSIGEAGYKLVTDKFTWLDSAKYLDKVYNEI